MPKQKADKTTKPGAIAGSAHNSESASEKRPNDSRRRFIKVGIAGAPLILTLKSRPAWGTDGQSDSKLASIAAGGSLQ